MSYLKVDTNITDAIDALIKYGCQPGSCTTLLLEGKYDEAYRHAHPHIKPHWDDHIKYIESLPAEVLARWRTEPLDEDLFTL